MSARNRQRKAENRRRREKASSSQLSMRETLYAAAGAAREGAGWRYRELLAVLAGGFPQAAVVVDVALRAALAQAQERRWEAGELCRQAERRLGSRHAGYVADLAGGGAGVAVDSLPVAVEVLALLLSLPALPRLGAAPSRRPQNTRVLEKVRALLAKAESTTFPEEAEALSAKAQELMARHAIDSAMVAAGAGAGAGPTGVRVPVDDPYAGAKSILLAEVAAANRCRAVWSKGLGFSTVLGFESDLEFVDVLYTSLLVQATSAMVAAGSQVDRSGRSRTRSFRQAFLLAYASRIGHRLRAAEAASRSAAAEEYGEALLPVLADRSAAVKAAEAEAFPHLVSRSVTIGNAAGWAAGAAAADLASLSGRTAVPARPPG
ncbi:MAG TPA: DUF2786 domain-containing protein [Acidimicrobiales bacterium]|nr:DUF2786 domain-containing protein [Acidimicrobiales bacterium]